MSQRLMANVQVTDAQPPTIPVPDRPAAPRPRSPLPSPASDVPPHPKSLVRNAEPIGLPCAVGHWSDTVADPRAGRIGPSWSTTAGGSARTVSGSASCSDTTRSWRGKATTLLLSVTLHRLVRCRVESMAESCCSAAQSTSSPCRDVKRSHAKSTKGALVHIAHVDGGTQAVAGRRQGGSAAKATERFSSFKPIY
jgi:hypothetical protein